MKARVDKGHYVIAISGGVDSMVLLDLVSQQRGVQLVVAHFDHGIREDSGEDEKIVRRVAKNYKFPVEVGHGSLGPKTSEEQARLARYKFLNSIKRKYNADAIITAHHQDDMIETAFINLLRGSGRKGLSAISDSNIVRPLLNTPKSEIIKYAKNNQIEWREDATNQEVKYLRNYLRQKILSKLNTEERQEIVKNIDKVAKANRELNKQIATLSHNIKQGSIIDRAKFTSLPQEIANELMAEWLRSYGPGQIDKKTVERLALALKTSSANTRQSVRKNLWLKIDHKYAHFSTTDQNA